MNIFLAKMHKKEIFFNKKINDYLFFACVEICMMREKELLPAIKFPRHPRAKFYVLVLTS